MMMILVFASVLLQIQTSPRLWQQAKSAPPAPPPISPPPRGSIINTNRQRDEDPYPSSIQENKQTKKTSRHVSNLRAREQTGTKHTLHSNLRPSEQKTQQKSQAPLSSYFGCNLRRACGSVPGSAVLAHLGAAPRATCGLDPIDACGLAGGRGAARHQR